ncbi:nuclear transport factor 2 family protein [Methanoregula sp.]|jgi:ketosteroid isomerase-like protein|uniref:nuclear transport factor 2 family protein n=1 Tax=Methanoregula sp. TaxID=2052170 RepID=UPI003C21362D
MKPITETSVRSLFASLESGKSDLFFAHVSDSVHWTVMGTHPLAGTYTGRQEFTDHTFRRLDRVLKDGVRLRVTGVLVSRTIAVVELEALSTANNGLPFHNQYCWICRFDGGKIVEVRAYLDSALVQKVIDENETEFPGNNSE